MRAREGAELAFQYTLAHDLGKTITEIHAMSCEEFSGWLAWYQERHERTKRK